MTRRTVGVTSERAAQGQTRAAEGAAPTDAGEVVDSPAMWDAHVARCLDGLSGPARRLVEVGAVIGSSFTIADAAEVLGQPAGSLMAAVEEAVDTGALVLTPASLEFRHEGIRRVAYDAVPSALASELALRALALTDAGDVDRCARTATVVENLLAAGRLEEADYLARRALGSHGMPASVAARLRLALGKVLLFSGRPGPAAVEIRAILSGTLVPGSLRAPAELFLVWAMLALDDRSGAASQVEAILSGGGGRDEVLSPALAALGVITWRDGTVADGLALARAAVLRCEREPPVTGDPFARVCLARMLTSIGELDEATQAIESAQARISASGDTLWSAAPAIAAARVDLAAGRIDAASASAHAAVDVATQLGTSCFLPAAHLVLAEVALMGGELAEAAAQLDGGDSGVAWPPWAASGRRLAEARLGEAQSGPRRVLERYATIYDDAAVDARRLLDDPTAAAWLVRTALAGDDPDRAERVAARAEQLAVVNAAFPAVVAASRHARGLADSDPCAVLEAAELHRHAGARAAAWEDAGVLRLGSGDRSAGRDLLERAVAASQQCGAERDAARVRSRLRAIGVRWRHGRRADRPVSGWASLTDTERAVAALVAEGLTNAGVAERMYLSRHTVDFNLRQMFRKLGIRSRVALTRLYLERPPGADADDHASS